MSFRIFGISYVINIMKLGKFFDFRRISIIKINIVYELSLV